MGVLGAVLGAAELMFKWFCLSFPLHSARRERVNIQLSDDMLVIENSYFNQTFNKFEDFKNHMIASFCLNLFKSM